MIMTRTLGRVRTAVARFARPRQMLNATGLSIDIGCGSTKKPGTLGIDIMPLAGVDFVADLNHDPLPFSDESVGYVFSSHFLEHIADPSRMLAEISRVCMDGAKLELWTPYCWSNDAFIYTHRTLFNEEHYLHPCVRYPAFWDHALHARWQLDELTYVIRREALAELRHLGLDLDFGLRHLHDVASEFCAHITVYKGSSPPPTEVRRTFAFDRHGTRYPVITSKVNVPDDSDLVEYFTRLRD